jgi:hypothetical protein
VPQPAPDRHLLPDVAGDFFDIDKGHGSCGVAERGTDRFSDGIEPI